VVTLNDSPQPNEIGMRSQHPRHLDVDADVLASSRIYGHIYGMKTTLVLKDDVVRRAKRRAAELGMTLSEFAERSLRDALAEKPVASRRIVLPTSGHGLPVHDHSVAELKALEIEDDAE
jgi:hypothetical protein